ncbi:MAG TPA: ABC transporter permease [Candidatus Saccharimonadales bacterium]
MNIDVIYALWLRQVRRYTRSGSRIIGTLGQPVLLLLALGYGIGAIYRKAGEGNYLQFLVPGIITQTVLLSSVFWGIIILQDKRFGFLSELLVAPVKRVVILLGSTLGGATISIMQGLLVFIIALLFGFRPYNWALVPPAFLVLVFMSMALTSFGAAIASAVDDFQGFQSINNLLVMPLFFLSSALYPLNHVPTVLRVISTCNPVSYMVDALRYLLANQTHFGLGKDLAVMAVTLAVCMSFAVNRFNRIQM